MQPCLHPELLRRGLDIPAMMRIAAGAGFPAMETSTRLLRALEGGVAAVQRLQEETGVRIVHTGWSAGLRSSRADFEAALPDTEAEMAFAAEIGSRGGTLVLPFRREPNVPDPDEADSIDRIQRLAEMAAGHDLRLVLEFVGLHIPGAPPHTYHDLASTLAVRERVRQSNVGVLIDSYHWYLSGGTVAEITAMPPGMPLFVHINDAPAGDVSMLTDAMRVLPGEGVIDLDGFLGAIAARGYDGPVSIELFSEEMRAMEPAESARRAYDAAAAAIRQATGRRAG
jgi:sugar phosphate isomerase/epimerase